MFKSREEELVLKKHMHKQLLSMFRNALSRVSKLKQDTLQVSIAANFHCGEFNFSITVFLHNVTNTTLTIYDFWKIERSQKLVDDFISAIRTGDFEKVRAAKTY